MTYRTQSIINLKSIHCL